MKTRALKETILNIAYKDELAFALEYCQTFEFLSIGWKGSFVNISFF